MSIGENEMFMLKPRGRNYLFREEKNIRTLEYCECNVRRTRNTRLAAFIIKITAEDGA